MNLVEEAVVFAAAAHNGQTRKMSKIPYLLHPLEVATIIATITDNEETIAAGVLHDTIEDCSVEAKTIKQKFGSRVAALVQSESEDKMSDRPPDETWKERKEESLLMLSYTKDRDVKILWLADKLSNMRSFCREYASIGDEMWKYLHQHDPKMHQWYYSEIIKHLSELSDTEAYKEFTNLVNKLFGGK